MLSFSQSQFDQFRDFERNKWVKFTTTKLYETFAGHYRSQEVAKLELEPVVDAVAIWAQRHGIVSDADVTRLVYIAASIGHRFWKDPRFARLIDAVLTDDVPQSRRSLLLTKSVKTWLQTVWASDTQAAYAQRLSKAIQLDLGPDVGTLRDILPGHWLALSAQDNIQLLDWLVTTIPSAMRGSSAHSLAYVACTLVHGVDWHSDPQLKRLQGIVDSDTIPNDMAEALVALYQKRQT